ncbi:MAG: hypothetical protein QF817_03425, partial [Candidatus Poseidoniaceae archaeon]|nr:hypothetical protein [Candidatus Poseidoniaceae archaeon]
MAGKSRTSKQKNRDDAEEAAVGDLFATSFDEIESADTPAANGLETTEDESPEPEEVDDSETTEEQSEEVAEDTTEEEQPGGAPANGAA